MATIAQFLISFVMLAGGVFLLGLAFSTPVVPGLVFVAGVLMFSCGFIMPMAMGRHGVR